MDKKKLLLTALFICRFASYAQTPVTVDANDVVNSNTKLIIQTAAGQSFFTGHQLGGGYAFPDGIFRAITDQANGSANVFFDGLKFDGASSYLRMFSVTADGQGFFAGNIGIGTPGPSQHIFGFNRFLDVSGASAPGLVFHSNGGSGQEAAIGSGGDGLILGASGAASAAGNNVIRFFTGNNNASYAMAERLRIDENGRVGIGKTNPRVRLDLGNPGSFPADLIGLYDGGGNTQYGMGININGANDNAGGFTLYSGDRGFVFRNNNINGNELMSITNAGKMFIAGDVGIGTTNGPQAKMHVNGSGSSSNATGQYTGDMIIQGSPGNRTSTTGASLEFVIPANSGGDNPWGQGRIITVSGLDNSTYNATGKMILGTRRSFNKGTGSGETWNYGDDLVIDGSGHIGIGTTTPSALLQVQSPGATGSTQIGSWVANPNAGTIYLNNDYTIANNYNFLSAPSAPLYINRATGQAMYFREGNGADQLTIAPGGSIGIGTDNPGSHKLAVNGSVHAKAVVVDLVGFPDYVFNKGYDLVPLGRLQSYIDKNHHLPEIPAAADVEQNGLDLGQMNKALLKKVEEMTLYLIAQDKRIREQDARLKKLEWNQSKKHPLKKLKAIAL